MSTIRTTAHTRAPAEGSPSQKIPSAGVARAALRARGQFWTPDWVADAMAAWACRGASCVLDPAVGGGSLLRAARRAAAAEGRTIRAMGCEVDPAALAEAARSGLGAEDLAGVALADFTAWAPPEPPVAVVGNPPYLRHHLLAPGAKASLHAEARALLGAPLDGRAGLHVFFLVRCLAMLPPGGRLAFIVPSDVCEGRSAAALWGWIAGRFRVEAAVTFAPGASPFPGVDTNPVLLFVAAAPAGGGDGAERRVWWGRVEAQGTPDLAAWARGGLGGWESAGLRVAGRALDEALGTGLTRPPRDPGHEGGAALGALFRVVRGVVTGDNGFFLMTRERMRALGLPAERFVRAIGRTRDAAGGSLSTADLDALDRAGRPTWLLDLGGEPVESLPPAVRAYLREGEARGLPGKAVLSRRSPWWRMERREPPPWLFAYLGRRDCRFIRNRAAAVPSTSFLCVYPRDPGLCPRAAAALLGDPALIEGLPLVAKSYGGGALKAEPRALERLPIPPDLLRRAGSAAHGVTDPGGRSPGIPAPGIRQRSGSARESGT